MMPLTNEQRTFADHVSGAFVEACPVQERRGPL